jgi:hypothetical protein
LPASNTYTPSYRAAELRRGGASFRIVSLLFGLVGGALGYVVSVILLTTLGVVRKFLFAASVVGVIFGGFLLTMAGALGWKHDILIESFYLMGGGIACGIIRDICTRLSAGYSQN